MTYSEEKELEELVEKYLEDHLITDDFKIVVNNRHANVEREDN